MRQKIDSGLAALLLVAGYHGIAASAMQLIHDRPVKASVLTTAGYC